MMGAAAKAAESSSSMMGKPLGETEISRHSFCLFLPIYAYFALLLVSLIGVVVVIHEWRSDGKDVAIPLMTAAVPHDDEIVKRITYSTTDGDVDHCQRRWPLDGDDDELRCKPWCLKRTEEPSEVVCGWKQCGDCSFCSEQVMEVVKEESINSNTPTTCPDWCMYRSENFHHQGSCNYDWAENCTSCGCSTFIDVTLYKIPKADPFFHTWFHSGKPYIHENTPIFLDLNGDGILDYFDSLHAHPLFQGKPVDANARFELTESVPYSFDADDVELPEEMRDLDMYRYRHVNQRIFIEELNTYHDLDPHGQNILDLDGDGIEDMMISSGGDWGALDPQNETSKSRNNFLLWGEKGYDELTGEDATIFRGGREIAEKAGVAMLYTRGRVNYMMDINNDGRIDIFCLQTRPVNNLLIPGVMLLNQGNRMWSPDMKMQEYTVSMVLTDADGDGIAQELVVSRSYCYPQRKGPEVDPSYPDYGRFPREVTKFCHTRPLGTIAVYKYNMKKEEMQEISPRVTTTPKEEDQPKNCPHGAWVVAQDCNAKSMATGDFDGDLIADLLVLYTTKIEIFLSSDRKKGAGVSYTEPNSVISIAADGCKGIVARVVDMDNDGREEILVMCGPGHFLLYTRGQDKDDAWHLKSPCSTEGALGDLQDPSLAGPSDQDYEEMCNILDQMKDYEFVHHGCEYFKGERSNPIRLVAVALATVDLNNDGFVDIVTTHHFGYTRFFYNVPGMSARRNRFITFRLVGGQKAGNVYGIGATVILRGERRRIQESGEWIAEPHHQFREKSTYQHTPDKSGSIDDRITFGLGMDIFPLNVTIRWSNGHETVKDLSQWNFEPSTYPIVLGE